MSNIRLFNQYAVDSDFIGTLGLGKLSDAISCTVTEERNGAFELEMEYPITGARYDQLALRMLIVCPPNPYDTPQAFRIYSISRAINGIVTINAQHISYDLSDAIVRTASESSNTLTPYDIFREAKGHLATGMAAAAFDFETTLTVDDSIVDANNNHLTHWELKEPKSLRRILLGDDDDSIMKNYVGSNEFGDEPEFTFDNHNIILEKERGADRGVTIRYRKNMTGFTYEESMEKLYTRVYPYFYASSITYNKDGKIDGEQKTIENFSVDLSFLTGTSFTTDPTLKTGIRDRNGNELNFRHVLPLDVSSLYDGEYAVNFANTQWIEKYSMWGYVYEADNIGHSIGAGTGQDINVRFGSDIRGGTFRPNTTYPKDHFSVNYFPAIHGALAPRGSCVLIDDLHVDGVGNVTTKVHIHCDDATISIGNLGQVCSIAGDGTIDKEHSNYINLGDDATLRFGAEQIKKAAERYIKENHMSKFPVSLKVDMTLASQIDSESLYKIKLCDKVKIEYPAYNVSVTAKCTKTVYDAIGNKYTELDFSNTWLGLASFTASNVNATTRSFRNLNYVGNDLNYLKLLSNF